MKNLILLAILLASLNSFGSTTFTIEGELQENINEDNDLIHLILTSHGESFKIVDFDKGISACKIGLFEIVNNFYPEDTYSLLEVYTCFDSVQAESDSNYCPEIYEPVCGLPKEELCTTDSCQVDITKAKTFSNYCQLHKAGANFMYREECTTTTTY